MPDLISRFGVLNHLRELAKKGASIEASIVSTFSLNGLFYEEVFLRTLERAGSRFNVLLVDAGQLAVALQEPVTRPRRAGRDYLLIPVDAGGAFHPKTSILFSQKKPMIFVGSHNVTESGYARNDEVTACWGMGANGVPSDILEAGLSFLLEWTRQSPGLEGLIDDLDKCLTRAANGTVTVANDHAAFIGWNAGKPSLLRQLQERIVGQVERISAISPYFDDELTFLQRLSADWKPKEIIVGIQSQCAMLLNPDGAPFEARFVEFSPPKGNESEAAEGDNPPFLHGKVLAFETDQGRYVIVGSPNASAPAWLQGEVRHGNAEAAILLNGDVADEAFRNLGLDCLASAPTLSAASLDEVVRRTKEARLALGDVSAPHIPTVSAAATVHGWLLPGLNFKDCRAAFSIGEIDAALTEAEFCARDGGTELILAKKPTGGGCLRIDGENGPLAFAILNDAPQLRKLMRPREAGRLLDALGRIDSFEGFDDLFDLFERHVLGSEPEANQIKSRASNPTAGATTPDSEQSAPGPRGVSIASLGHANSGKKLQKDDLIADFLKALIRDLATSRSETSDGEKDEEETGAKSNDKFDPESPLSLAPGEWERLVTTCRRRVGVLINRLEKRLAAIPQDADAASALAGKVLTVICLIQKLRMMQPPEGSPMGDAGKLESLVSSAQLRTVFKLAMHAMYSSQGLARTIESSSALRGSEDRRILDATMLWAAREIGIDFDMAVPFNEKPEWALAREHDKIDGLVASISAAAHFDIVTFISAIPVRTWADAPKLRADWVARHIALGDAFQDKFSTGSLPTLQRPVIAHDIVVWKKEPLFPRLVAELASKNAVLFEPGDVGSGKPLVVRREFLQPLDLDSLRPA